MEPTGRRGGDAAAHAAIFCLALALRVVYAAELHGSLLFTELFGDGQQYDAWAREIAAGDWFGREVFYLAPLYPYFLGALYTAVGRDLDVVRAVQAVLGSASCVMIAMAGRRWVGRRAGLLAGFLVAVYPPAIFFDGLVQKASLDLFLTSALLALLAAYQARPRRLPLAAAGAVLGALTLSRENARVLYAIVLPWLWLEPRAAPVLRRLGFACVFVAAAVCVVLPVAWRNHRIGGEWLASTSQLGANLWIGNHPGANGLYTPLVPGRGDARAERADATRLAEAAIGRTLTPGEVSDYWAGRFLSFVREEPLAFLRLLAWKGYLSFHAFELADSESFEVFAAQSRLLRALRPALGFGVLVPLAVLGLWATRRRRRELLLLYALVLSFAASVALFYVFARYRYPLVPVLALFAGAALAAAPVALRSLGSAAGRREWLPGIALAALAAVLVNWPLPGGYRDDEVTWYNVGLTLLERGGREADAARSFEEALRIEGDFGLARYQLGRAYAQLGRLADAERELRAATRAAPGLADAHYGYATLLLLRAPGSAEAIVHLRRAVELAPEAAGPRVDLAFSLATSSDPGLRDGREAIALLEPLASTALGETPQVLDALAAAYADVGRFDEAVAAASRAAERARAAGQEAIARIILERRALYAAGRPFRQAPPPPPAPGS
jgi:4-amino-4-deoxy-L-arabinose transferase-like glycosyltransferase